METIIFLLLVVILILIVTNNSSLKEKVDALIKKQEISTRTINQLSEQIAQLKINTSSSSYTSPVAEERTVEKTISEPPKVEDVPVLSLDEIWKPTKVEPEPIIETASEKEEISAQEPIAAFTPPAPRPAPVHKPTFWERNPDLEKFIGENLINKIGIAILVIGIGFFVKYAIDQNWINEIGRVAIGIGCGGILMGIAHKLRSTFKAFSSVLVGGGLAVFYFTIAIAFQEYQLFSKGAAFGLMVAITGFAILLSIAYNRIELAILAIVGGFTSPFFVSDGSGNYIVMYVYILILNVGMLILAYFKRWNLVNIVSFAFTVLLFGGWLTTKVIGQENAPYAGALIFATCFFIVFFLMNIINNVRENRKFVYAEISILLANTALYYSAGMLILQYLGEGAYQGLFTALIGLFNLVFAYSLYTTKRADKNLVYLLIGLVLTFASLTAPVQLEGNYITMFWALEGVLLLWLSQKSGIALLKTASVIVTFLMLISLVMDWNNLYGSYREAPLSFFLNKAFITSLICALSLSGYTWLLKNEAQEFLPSFPTEWSRYLLYILMVVVLYVMFLLEFYHQTLHRVPSFSARELLMGSYHLSFTLGLIFAIRKRTEQVSIILRAGLTAVLSFIYLVHFNPSAANVRDFSLLGEVSSFYHFYHYLVLGLILGIHFLFGKWVLKHYMLTSIKCTVYFWALSLFLIYLASAELEHLVVFAAYDGMGEESIYHLKQQVFRIGFPILWGICSFFLMYLGMKHKVKSLRIIALSGFAFTLLKLFIFDVSRMGEGGKIAAFISLGVLLLVISFMYQKLKKLIIEDEGK